MFVRIGAQIVNLHGRAVMVAFHFGGGLGIGFRGASPGFPIAAPVTRFVLTGREVNVGGEFEFRMEIENQLPIFARTLRIG